MKPKHLICLVLFFVFNFGYLSAAFAVEFIIKAADFLEYRNSEPNLGQRLYHRASSESRIFIFKGSVKTRKNRFKNGYVILISYSRPDLYGVIDGGGRYEIYFFGNNGENYLVRKNFGYIPSFNYSVVDFAVDFFKEFNRKDIVPDYENYSKNARPNCLKLRELGWQNLLTKHLEDICPRPVVRQDSGCAIL